MGLDIPQDKKGGIPMTLKEAITLFSYHQRSSLKARTVRSYQPLLKRFQAEFGERSFDSIGGGAMGSDFNIDISINYL
jgi:hypothetical protein